MTEAYVWKPTADIVERANVTRLARRHNIESYEDLSARSRDDIEWFWPAVVADLALEFTDPYTEVLDATRGIQWPLWFVGGRIKSRTTASTVTGTSVDRR
jgi:acetyl-CoA synthetase